MQLRTLTPPKRRRRLPIKRLVASLIILVLVGSYSAVALAQPLRSLQPNANQDALSITTPSTNLPWPAYGEAAYGLSTGEVIATNGQQTPLATASAAKLITALAVIQKHPLTASQHGPTITLTDQDYALFQHYISVGGSIMIVRAGMQLTERQMLEAMLLPSANNIADTLAIWSFGSINNYIAYANNFLQTHGLANTHVAGDASGFLPDTTSTPSDLVKIGGMVMQNPALASIVGEKTAVIPDIGIVSNYNNLLGTNGIVGIKTGNNDADTGVFVGAAQAQFGGKTTTVITVIMGAPSLNTALRDSGTLLAAVQTTFADTQIVATGTILGGYVQADGHRLQAVAANDLTTTVLRGTTVKANVQLNTIRSTAVAGQTVGSVSVPASQYSPARSVPIILKQAPTTPSVFYRLTHP